MIVKCTKCNVVEDITGENLELLAKMISLYNPKPKSSDYVAVLSIIKGDCIDREKHVFSFDESFMQDIDGIIHQHEEAVNRLSTCNGDLLKTDENINKNISEIKELEARAKEIESKIEKLQGDKDNITKEIDNIDISILDIKTKLQNLTGIKDIKIWS
jgi:predicted RNase H-like nuclease (RuvC/YqgF family)